MYLQYVFICICTIDDLLYFMYSMYFYAFNYIQCNYIISIYKSICKNTTKNILVKIPLKKENMD